LVAFSQVLQERDYLKPELTDLKAGIKGNKESPEFKCFTRLEKLFLKNKY
jgi:hypothetical protein